MKSVSRRPVRPAPRRAPRPPAWPRRAARSIRPSARASIQQSGSASSSSTPASAASASSTARSSAAIRRLAFFETAGLAAWPVAAAAVAGRLRLPAWRLPRRHDARRARARSRPSRPRYECSRPSSMAIVRVPTASSSARSWDTSSSAPSNARSASSSASRLSRSRWLVGSSRIRTFAPEATRIASESRRSSPPESTDTSFSASAPENRNRPSSARALFGSQPGRTLRGLEHRSLRHRSPRRAGRGSRARRCGRVAACRRASGRRPASVSISVVLPAPLGPTRVTCSPRSSHSSAPSSSLRSPAAIVASSSSSTTRPLRVASLNLNPGALPALRSRSSRSHLRRASSRAPGPGGSVFPRGSASRTAPGARSPPAGARSPGRSASSRAAFSLRQACHGPAKKRDRPRLQLEHRGADRLQEPAVVRDQHDRRVDGRRAAPRAIRATRRRGGWWARRAAAGPDLRRACARATPRVSSPPEKVRSGRSRSSSAKPSPRTTAVARRRQS